MVPDVDDAFAEGFGVADGGVDVLRGEVRANMERELADGLRRVLKQRVMEALLDGNEIELPTSMVRDGVARAMQRRREELVRSGIDPQHVELEPNRSRRRSDAGSPWSSSSPRSSRSTESSSTMRGCAPAWRPLRPPTRTPPRCSTGTTPTARTCPASIVRVRGAGRGVDSGPRADHRRTELV